LFKRFGLKNPIFLETASYGHFGRECFKKKVEVYSNGKKVLREVEFFAWEKLDYIDKNKESVRIERNRTVRYQKKAAR